MALSGGKTYIAAHSGIFAGNLIRNTIPSFEAALRQGSDILEVDVARSKDGSLFIFHEGFEKRLLGSDKAIANMTDVEIAELRYINLFDNRTELGLDTLDSFLEHFKNRCYINLDRSWGKLPEVIQKVKDHNMSEQIIIKTHVEPVHLKCLEELAGNILYMPILKNEEQLREVQNYNVNLCAAEILFKSLDEPMVQPDMMRKIHESGILLWVNAIVYNYKHVLSAGYTDDISLVQGPDKGWGKLMDMGFDIIQTDFPDSLRLYIQSREQENIEIDMRTYTAV